jgi:hypothetical protein
MLDTGIYRMKSPAPLPTSSSVAIGQIGKSAVGALPVAEEEEEEEEEVEWEALKGAPDTSADAEESDDDDDDDNDDDDGDDNEKDSDSGKEEEGNRDVLLAKTKTKKTKKTKKKKKNGKKKKERHHTFPWQPFPSLRVAPERDGSANTNSTFDSSIDSSPRCDISGGGGGGGGSRPGDHFGSTRSPLTQRRPFKRPSSSSSWSSSTSSAQNYHIQAGLSGYLISGLPILVGGRGTFLRMAAPVEEAVGAAAAASSGAGTSGAGNGAAAGVDLSARISFDGGVTSAQRPLLVHGAPVYK